ncbi:MAG: hypothetical protein JSR93_06990, partial [Verrucomicrobia bacterium]|nr:hypothetical protein [Verrucomicrobiota bacterium]
GSWLHDDFPDFETKDNIKTRKKSLGFSLLLHRENWITSGATIYSQTDLAATFTCQEKKSNRLEKSSIDAHSAEKNIMLIVKIQNVRAIRSGSSLVTDFAIAALKK